MGMQQFDISTADIIRTKQEAYRAGLFRALDLIPKQMDAMKALCLMPDVTEVLYGGAAGGGKTFTGSEWLLWNCICYPGTRWFVARQTLKQIRDSVFQTFFKACKKHSIPSEDYRYNDVLARVHFANGSEIIGIETAEKASYDPDYDRFGSMEFTGGWIEEIGGVPAKAYEVLKSRIGRHLNDKYNLPPKLLLTCNPTRNFVYRLFYKPFKDGTFPADKVFIQSRVDENTKVDTGYRKQLEGLTGYSRARLLLGDWEYQDDPLALIEFDAIGDLYTNSYIAPDLSDKKMIVDVATHGSDLFRISVFYGFVMVEQTSMEKSGGREIITRIQQLQARHGIRGGQIIYDADGVGSFVGQKGGFIPGAIPFHGGAAPFPLPTDKGRIYANLRSQCGFWLADYVNDGKLYLPAVSSAEDQETLTDELAWIKRASDSADGPLRLIAKDEIRKGLGRSPDFADLLLMLMWFELRRVSVPVARVRKLY
jgi:phage terminase large subunit